MNRRAILTTLAATAAAAGAPRAGSAASPEPRNPYVPASDGEQLFVQDWGAGRPVVFVHGWSMSSAFWDCQTEALVDRGLRCIAYDQRGCGRSTPAASGYDFDTLADDLEAVLSADDLRDVVLVSHSMGAGEVARYLSRHGTGRVAKVALISCTTPNLDGAAHVEASEQALRADRPGYVRALAAPFFAPARPSQALVDWGVDLVLQASLRASIGYNRCNLTTDLTQDMRAFTVPTLVIHGGGDVSSPLARTGAPTAAMIPGARLLVYEDAGHGLPLTHAARLNRDLAEFALS